MLLGFAETQTKSSDSISRIDEQLNDLNINFNNNDDINGMSIISLGKDKFIERVFNLMLVYRKHTMQVDELCRMLEYYPQQMIEMFLQDTSSTIFQKCLQISC